MRGLSGKKCLEFRYAARFDSAQDTASGAHHRSTGIAERASNNTGFGGVAWKDHSFPSILRLVPLKNSVEKLTQIEYPSQKRCVNGLINERSAAWIHVSKCSGGQSQEQGNRKYYRQYYRLSY